MPKNIVKRFFTLTVFLAAFSLSGCLEESTSAESTSSTITNSTSQITAGGTYYASFTLKRTATVNVDVTVTKGDGVQIYLLESIEQLVNLENRMAFSYKTALSAPYEVTSFNKSATLPAGEWIVAIYNPNTFFSQTVRREISVNY